jgi:signal transduction histidine kinase
VPNSLALLCVTAAIQLVLIIALLAQWQRGRRSMHRLVEERIGVAARSGALVHQLNQPLTAILSNAQAAQRFLAAERPDVQELREILNDIVIDDKRAAGIVRSLGSLFTETKVLETDSDSEGKPGDN